MEDQLHNDLRLQEDLDSYGYSTNPTTPPVNNPTGEDEVVNYERALPEEITDQDVKEYTEPDSVYDTVLEAESKPPMNFDNPEVSDEEAIGRTKQLGISFYQGVYDGFEEMGLTLADIADYVTDMEDPKYFRKHMESFQLQDREVEAANRAIMQADTANALVGGVGQFLAGFVPALKIINFVKVSGKVPPWVKKTIGSGVAGAAADFSVWDYTDKKAVDFIDSYGDEVLSDLYTKYKDTEDDRTAWDNFKGYFAEKMTSQYVKALKFDDTVIGQNEDGSPIYADNAMQGRMKQAIEGFVIGKILDPVLGSLRFLTRSKRGRDKSIIKPYEKAKGKVEYSDNNTNTGVAGNDVDTEMLLEPGAKVKAADRDNTGTVIGVDSETGKAKVKFKNKANGRQATVTLDTDQLTVIGSRPLTKVEKAKLKMEQPRELSKSEFSEFRKNIQAGKTGKAINILAKNLDEAVMDGATDMESINRLVAESLELAEASTREVSTWKKAAQKSQAKLKSGDQAIIDAGLKATKDLDSTVLAVRTVQMSALKRLGSAFEKYHKKTISKEKLKETLGYAIAVSAKAKEVSGNVGASLNIHKFMDDKGVLQYEKMFNTLSKKGYNSTDDMLKKLEQLNLNEIDLASVDILDTLGERSFKRAWIEAFINGVLSPTSLGINLTSNAIMMVARTADIHMAAFKGTSAVTHKQAFAHTFGYLSSIMEATLVAFKSYTKNRPMYSKQAWENEFVPKAAITSDNLGFRRQSPGDQLGILKKSVNGTIDTIGKVIRGVPGATRSMMATDEFFKLVNGRAFMYKQAMEAVERDGFDMLTKPKLTALEFNKRFSAIKAATSASKKSNDPDAILAREAMEQSHLATFTNTWGEGGERFYSTLRSQPLTSFILPFVRQPVNNLLYVARSTPGLNLMQKRLSAEIAAGGARAEIALAHLNVGAMIWAYAMFTAFGSQGKLTGNPKSSASYTAEGRDIGIDPNTFQNEEGDFVNYRGGEPVASKWAILAGLSHEWSAMMNEAGPHASDEEIEQAAWDMALSGSLIVLDNFKDMSSLRGLEQMLKLIEGGTEGRFKPAAESMLAGWVSVMSGQIKYFREKVLGEDQYKINPEGLAEAIDSRYGGALGALGFVETVPALNAFGDVKPGAQPMMLSQVLGNDSDLNPGKYVPTNIRKTPGFEEAYQKEIVRLRQALPNEVILGKVPTSIEEVKIDNRERHNLLKFLKHHKINGRTLKTDMDNLMKSREYKTSPDKLKTVLVRELYQAHMDVAEQMLLSDAAKYYENPEAHVKRGYFKKYGLLPYARSKSLSSVARRKKAKETNRLLSVKDRRKIDLKSFEEDTEREQRNQWQQMRSLFK